MASNDMYSSVTQQDMLHRQPFSQPRFEGGQFRTPDQTQNNTNYRFFQSQNQMGATNAQERQPRCRPSVLHDQSHLPLSISRAQHDGMEHLLRRKTPNGTLAAAYDGSSQDWAIRPPASKIPRQSRAGSDSTGAGWYSCLSEDQHAVSLQGMPANWPHIPQLSSSPYPWNGGTQVPTVLQPMWQPAGGPTASNPPQFYGPYWPDGSYTPYKPAFVQNYHHHRETNSGHPDASTQMSNLKFGPSLQTQSRLFDAAYMDHISTTGRSPFEQHPEGTPLPYQHLTNADNTFPTSLLGSRLPFELQLSRGSNYQFKDRVLEWAQKVYLNLLAQLQQADSRNQRKRSQGHPRSRSQPNIYPSLPRQASHIDHTATTTQRKRSEDQRFYDIPPLSIRPVNSSDRRHSNSTISDWQHDCNIPSLGQPATATSLPRFSASPMYSGGGYFVGERLKSPSENAKAAVELLNNLCQESQWSWIDGMLLGGCLAYGLENYDMALNWYNQIITLDPWYVKSVEGDGSDEIILIVPRSHVEAISNIAATLLALNRREEAEDHWLRAVHLRPSYFEAVEHLIGLLCADHRSSEAIKIIDFVEKSLRIPRPEEVIDQRSDVSSDGEASACRSTSFTPSTEALYFDFEDDNSSRHLHIFDRGSFSSNDGVGSSGYRIPGTENGRMLALIHAKGNLSYGLGDIEGASKAFEDAVLVSTGRRRTGIRGLIDKILSVVSPDSHKLGCSSQALNCVNGSRPVLLSPEAALRTAPLVFAPHGELPGLKYLAEGMARKAALATTSNSLLSLAKIFQDGLSNASSFKLRTHKPTGIGDILALYYLSLSLQPSPSTANNVGILLASVQHSSPSRQSSNDCSIPTIPGVVPGSGVALALAYYNYGLNLDSRHAHLFTNLGSLLKDIGQLNAAIKMYEQAVACDGNFDIALANLANAVKDQGRISDAISYYKRAVEASPDFAEAVCGLANALNSVCEWTDRGGVLLEKGKFERWHVDHKGMIYDSRTQPSRSGWMKRVITIVEKQLAEGANWGKGVLQEHAVLALISQIELADTGSRWPPEKSDRMRSKIMSWAGRSWEGARTVRLVERAVKRAMHRWYKDKYVLNKHLPKSTYPRPVLPSALSMPGAPTVLPFHTFTCPLTARDIRMISERNALRISCSTLRASWLPTSVYPPPAPPCPFLNVGYVSSDFNNHPLAHLMQSVFGLHDRSKVKAFCYATTPSDNSVHRQQIEREAPVFQDASSWSAERLIHRIVSDNIHILVNLNGYTRGARNEIFAARPAPIQMSFMGFAGTLGAEWCDYLLADKIAIPTGTLRPRRRNVEIEDQIAEGDIAEEAHWVYSENIIYCRDTFFCCDHRQSSKDTQLPWADEQQRRWEMRKKLFPNLSDSAIILGNFNQLYKVCLLSLIMEAR